MKGFLPLKEILKDMMKTYGIEGELLEVQRHWEEIVGGDLKDYVWPKSIKDHILFVETKSLIWKSEVKLRKRRMLECMEGIFGKGIVRDIRVR